MTRLVTSLLIIGYLAFVPYCFLGMSVAHTHAKMDMTAQLVPGDCCTKTDPKDTLQTHALMYLLFTGTPLLAVVLLTLALFTRALLPSSLFVFAPQHIISALAWSPPQRRALFFFCTASLRAWLSLNETSPTFA